MKKKVTLNLKKTTIERAKIYAKRNKTSVSAIIENYLSLLTSPSTNGESEEMKITPLVESLMGVASLTDDYDFRSDYTEYLIKKYM